MSLTDAHGPLFIRNVPQAVRPLIQRGIRPFAIVWAALLPIEVITGVHVYWLDAIRHGGALVLLLVIRPEPREPSDRTVAWLAGGVVVLGAMRIVSGLARSDSTSIRVGLVLAAGAAVAALLVRRRSLFPTLTIGYLAGLAVSATVCLMQAMHLPTLNEASTIGRRNPGLATFTTVFSWQMAGGLIIAFYLVAAGRTATPRQRWSAISLIPLFSLAILANGAQGGLLGLGAAVIAMVAAQRRRMQLRQVAGYALAAGAVVAITGAMIALGVEVPTVTDYLDSDFTNEKARAETIREGIDVFLAHPLTGIGHEAYLRRYDGMPHFLPVDFAAVTGIGGLVMSVLVVGGVAWLVLRGPNGVTPSTLLGQALLASAFVRFLTEPIGPVLGLTRMLLLLTAVHLARSRPVDETPIRETPGLEGPQARPTAHRSLTTAAEQSTGRRAAREGPGTRGGPVHRLASGTAELAH